MKISVDFTQDMHPVSQLILSLLYQGEFDLIKKNFSVVAPTYLQALFDTKYILSSGPYSLSNLSDIAVSTSKAKVLFGELSSSSNWIDTYRDLFKGKKIGAMGHRAACILKMDKFLKQYPYSRTVILAATERYINSQRQGGYAYLQQADYFIFKNEDFVGSRISNSRLATFCEEVALLDSNVLQKTGWEKKAI
jgi:hypothetical protein